MANREMTPEQRRRLAKIRADIRRRHAQVADDETKKVDETVDETEEEVEAGCGEKRSNARRCAARMRAMTRRRAQSTELDAEPDMDGEQISPSVNGIVLTESHVCRFRIAEITAYCISHKFTCCS